MHGGSLEAHFQALRRHCRPPLVLEAHEVSNNKVPACQPCPHWHSTRGAAAQGVNPRVPTPGTSQPCQLLSCFVQPQSQPNSPLDCLSRAQVRLAASAPRLAPPDFGPMLPLATYSNLKPSKIVAPRPSLQAVLQSDLSPVWGLHNLPL